MTKEELHKIGTAMQPFLQFLRDTEKGEGWHATRQQLWAHTERQIAALVGKLPDESPDKKVDKKRGTKSGKKTASRPVPPGKQALDAAKH